MENQSSTQTAEGSFKGVIFNILQVSKNKPRSVKIIQWVLLILGILLFIIAKSISYPVIIEVLIYGPFFLSFALLYIYKHWSLILLRILSFYPIIMFPLFYGFLTFL